MSNNAFSNNTWAVATYLTDETTDITLINNTSAGAAPNGFGRNGFGIWGSIAGNNTFTGQNNFPFILWEDVTINEGAALSFTPGTTVKFNDFYDGFVIAGSLNAIGTETDSIVFTALADDFHGGDSNGDGDATSPAPNQWSTIEYQPGSSGALNYCFVGYGGGEYSANIHANDNDVNIENSTVVQSSERGIYVADASPNIQFNNIINNTTDGVYTISGALPILQNNNIMDNGTGVYNADPNVDVDARNNWWGDITGPHHQDLNPSGIGNSVSDHVLFQPWLESPVGVIIAVNELPDDILVDQIFPNPINTSSHLNYFVKKSSRVSIGVCDLWGRKILTLIDAYQTPGEYSVTIDGSQLARGMYFLYYKNGNKLETQKFTKK